MKDRTEKEVYEDVGEKFEELEKGVPYLNFLIKKKKKKKAVDHISYLVYILQRMYKIIAEKGTHESIDDLKGRLWWFNKQRETAKRKFLDVKKLYSGWANYYDVDNNLIIFLEEKVTKDWFNFKNKEILDFGCGTGRYTIPLAKNNKVTAIDFTPAMLNLAKEKAKKSKVTKNIVFKRGDITKFKPKKQYEVIISMLVLDHIKDLKKIIDILDESSKIRTQVVISNVHPELLRKDLDIRTGKTQGYLVDGKKTNQFYHSLEEYVNLFLEKGFVLTGTKNLLFEKKYQKIKKFKKFMGIKNQAIGIIMRFEKIR